MKALSALGLGVLSVLGIAAYSSYAQGGGKAKEGEGSFGGNDEPTNEGLPFAGDPSPFGAPLQQRQSQPQYVEVPVNSTPDASYTNTIPANEDVYSSPESFWNFSNVVNAAFLASIAAPLATGGYKYAKDKFGKVRVVAEETKPRITKNIEEARIESERPSFLKEEIKVTKRPSTAKFAEAERAEASVAERGIVGRGLTKTARFAGRIAEVAFVGDVVYHAVKDTDYTKTYGFKIGSKIKEKTGSMALAEAGIIAAVPVDFSIAVGKSAFNIGQETGRDVENLWNKGYVNATVQQNATKTQANKSVSPTVSSPSSSAKSSGNRASPTTTVKMAVSTPSNANMTSIKTGQPAKAVISPVKTQSVIAATVQKQSQALRFTSPFKKKASA